MQKTLNPDEYVEQMALLDLQLDPNTDLLWSARIVAIAHLNNRIPALI